MYAYVGDIEQLFVTIEDKHSSVTKETSCRLCEQLSKMNIKVPYTSNGQDEETDQQTARS